MDVKLFISLTRLTGLGFVPARISHMRSYFRIKKVKVKSVMFRMTVDLKVRIIAIMINDSNLLDLKIL